MGERDLPVVGPLKTFFFFFFHGFSTLFRAMTYPRWKELVSAN
jgi:hypothetical protein